MNGPRVVNGPWVASSINGFQSIPSQRFSRGVHAALTIPEAIMTRHRTKRRKIRSQNLTYTPDGMAEWVSVCLEDFGICMS